MSNEAVAALSLGSRYCSFKKTVMADKVWKILGKLKPGLRRPPKVRWVIQERWSTFIVDFKLSLTFDI